MDTTNKSRSIISALLVLLVIVGGYFWFTKGDTAKVTEEVAYTSAEGVETETIDLSVGTGERLPQGFPEWLPVEINNLKESYKQTYNDQGLTLYTAGFTSQKSRDALWEDYSRLLVEEGYVVDTTATDKSKGTLRATKGNNEVFAVISSKDGASYVQLNYIERKNE